MYGREKLKLYWGGATLDYGVYEEDEADKVMDAMEARIKELVKTKRDILTRNVELIGENAQLTMEIKELEERVADAEKRAEKMFHNYEWAQSTIKELEAEVEMDAKKRRIMIDGYNQKCERVKELEAQLPKWISVKDRLPEFGVNVLIYDGKYYNVMWRDECEKNGYYWDDGECGAHKDMVTHWMPLPPPPSIEDSSPIEKEM